jgi:hypothetical protein
MLADSGLLARQVIQLSPVGLTTKRRESFPSNDPPHFFASRPGGSPRWSLSLAQEVLLGLFSFAGRMFSVGTRLYVGNLSYNVTNQTLESLFSEHGRVKSAQVVQDRDTGRSKGFGFVEMTDGSEAQAAIQALNLKEVEGRCLTVNEARPREERGGGGGGYGGGGGGGGGRGGRRY